MELLLFRYREFNLAVDLRQIRAVRRSDGRRETLSSGTTLLETGNSSLMLELRGGQRLPADDIMEIAQAEYPLQEISPFLAGCFQSDIGSGFLIRKKGVFLILNEHFLNGGQDEDDKKHH